MNTSSTVTPQAGAGVFIAQLSIILLSVALVVGVPGNSFVVWSILKRMHKRSVTALLVLNLALADLAVLLTAPFFLHFLAQGTWRFKQAGCSLLYYICGVSMYASVLIITAMSLDRSLAVARPFLSQKLRTKSMARYLLTGIWVLSFLLATPVFVYRKVNMRLDNRSQVCFPVYPSESHRVFHLLFEALTGFLLPFMAVVASYSDIGRRLQTRHFRRSRRTGRLVVLIILAFAAFWLPYHIVNVAEAFQALAGLGMGTGPTGQRLYLARHVLIALAFLSSSVNPVLYACNSVRLLRSTGMGFVAKMLEATGSEAGSSRRGGTLDHTVKNIPMSPEPVPVESSTVSTNPLE